MSRARHVSAGAAHSLYRRMCKTVVVPPTVESFAARLGVSMRTASRYVAYFHRQKWITRKMIHQPNGAWRNTRERRTR